MEKRSRGIETNRGRPQALTDTESYAIEEACLSFALAGGNKSLAVSLGQKVTLRKIKCEELPGLGLPNPVLALQSGKEEQLGENVSLIDQRFPRSPSAPQQRLILAIDHTYLQKRFVQACLNGTVGLVGGPWSPTQEQSCFLPLADMQPGTLKAERASMMLECLCWDPCAEKRESYSIASMPMTLKRAKRGDMTLTRHGNMAPWHILAVIFMMNVH